VPDGRAVSPAPELWARTNADIVAYLHDYPMLVPPEFLETVTREALKRAVGLPIDMDLHVYASLERLARRLDAERRSALVTKLTETAMHIADRDPEHWNRAVASPLWIAPSSASPLLHLMPFDVENQRPDGSWRPRFRWNRDPEAWEDAEQEWAGIITLERLLQLRDFGRIVELGE
jgi:hypothetical protein